MHPSALPLVFYPHPLPLGCLDLQPPTQCGGGAAAVDGNTPIGAQYGATVVRAGYDAYRGPPGPGPGYDVQRGPDQPFQVMIRREDLVFIKDPLHQPMIHKEDLASLLPLTD